MVGGEQTVWLLQCAFLLILAALLSRVVMGFYHAYTKLFGAARNTLFAHNIIPRALLGVGTGTFGAWFAWQIFRESMHRRMGADVLLRLNPVVLISTVLLGGAWGLLIAYTRLSYESRESRHGETRSRDAAYHGPVPPAVFSVHLPHLCRAVIPTNSNAV